MTVLNGSCLCGAIEFTFDTDERNVAACYCSQRRRWSGHYRASVSGPRDGLALTKGEDKVRWVKSSKLARRGFGACCGSALFWHGEVIDNDKDRIAVAAGTFAGDPSLKLTQHIFVADKGCYYEIADGLAQHGAE